MTSPILGLAMRTAHRLRRAVWRRMGYRPSGVHGIVLDPAGRIVLVRLTYFPGWHLPGGGRKRREDPEAAMRRELREEIGLDRCGSLALLQEWQRSDGGLRGHDTLFLARDAAYRPRRSLEIAETKAFPLDGLPDDLAPWARAVIARHLPA